MGARDLGGDVQTEPSPCELDGSAPRANGWNRRLMVSGPIGGPRFATDSSNRRRRFARAPTPDRRARRASARSTADWRTVGRCGRGRRRSAGSSRCRCRSSRSGCAVRISATTWSSMPRRSASSRLGSATARRPDGCARSRARCRSGRSSARRCGRSPPRSCAARCSSPNRQQHLRAGLDRGERIAQVVPEHRDELILEVRALRRAFTSAASLVDSRSWASRCMPIRSANSLNMPMVCDVVERAGRGSIAHNVPKNRPSGDESARKYSSGTRTASACDARGTPRRTRRRRSRPDWPVWRISLQIVLSICSSPPGTRPKLISSRTRRRSSDLR